MKRIMHYSIGLLSLMLLILVTYCGKNPSASTSLQKNSVVLMKAKAKLHSTSSMSDIPVPGGSVNVQFALLNIEKYRIEENSGVENEQQGQHEDNDSGGSDNEQEAPDIAVTGPFSIDISNGETFIDSVAVYPGTFKKVDFTFMLNSAPPFDGKTIVISGEFIPVNGTAIPMTIKSTFAQEIQIRIAGGGITVAANSTVPVVVTFDLTGMFNNVDFGSAQVSNGEIIVDNVSNTALLAAFEANLAKYVEVEEKM